MSQHEENQSTHQHTGATDGAVLLKSAADRLREEEKERQRRDQKQRYLQLWFNGLLVLTSIITAGVVTYQGWVMRRSLNELTRQAAATERSSDASKSASDTAAQALKDSESSFDKTLEQMKTQTSAIKDSVAVARDSLISVQRAFVTSLKT